MVGVLLAWKFKLKLFASRIHAFVVLGAVFLAIVAWDSFAVFSGWWAFPGPGLVGITVGLLPIEEYSLAIIVPFFVIVFYKFVEAKLK